MRPSWLLWIGHWCNENAQEGQDDTDNETCEHPCAGDLHNMKDRSHICWQSYTGTNKKLTQNDFHGVEPICRLVSWAGCDSLPLVASAVVPQTDLVVIVKANWLSDSIDEICIGYGLRYHIGEIDFQEICLPYHHVIVDVSNLDQDEEYHRDQIYASCKQSKTGWFVVRSLSSCKCYIWILSRFDRQVLFPPPVPERAHLHFGRWYPR